jgi:hypothetical protein
MGLISVITRLPIRHSFPSMTSFPEVEIGLHPLKNSKPRDNSLLLSLRTTQHLLLHYQALYNSFYLPSN